MGGELLYFKHELETVTCANCGIEFAMPKQVSRSRREDHQNFYCPNGHSQYFPAETEAEKLKKKLDAEVRRREWAERERDTVTKKLKKTEKRIARGVCPCCNRTFINLQRHMKCKHKEYVGTK